MPKFTAGEYVISFELDSAPDAGSTEPNTNDELDVSSVVLEADWDWVSGE